MTIKNTTETETEAETNATDISPEQATEDQDGKLLLGKRVLRHFGVRTDVQAGSEGITITRRCK